MYTLEICCGSAADAVEAYQGGAGRVELNSDLFHGGLTPSLGSLLYCRKKAPALSVICMVRPREGGFCYTPEEFAIMQEDARLFLENDADGIVFGLLLPDGSVDQARCRILTELAHSYGKAAVFHRAIDVVPDWRKALDILIELGIDRVLTSGQQATALEGASVIREMIQHAAGRIEILPGSGIKPHNAKEILAATEADQLHASLRRSAADHTATANPLVHFSGSSCPPEENYYTVMAEDIAKFVAVMNG